MRDLKTRKADVLAALEKQQDLWVSSADATGRPHLIAVSAWWDGNNVVIATTAASRTAANLRGNHRVRLAHGTPADAVVIDALVVEILPANSASEDAEGFARAVGWDPREVGDGWVFFRMRPMRIQAYRGYDELEGREVMRQGAWLA